MKVWRPIVVALLVIVGFSAPAPSWAAAQPDVIQKVTNPMPPAPFASRMSSAERSEILHLYYHGPRVRLTFDDCATQVRLTGLLNWLRHYNVQAIFFFTGQCMLAHPTYRTQISRAGQLLGNHSFDHRDYSRMTANQIYTEVRRHGSVIPTTSPKLCRPPYGAGAFSLRVYNALARAGCRPAYWTVDTRDWDGSSAGTIIRRVQFGDRTTPRVRAGGVILMHGTGPHTLQALTGVRNALIYWRLATFHIH